LRHTLQALVRCTSKAPTIQSYGPESIMDGIARIAPQYESLAARFDREVNEAIGPTQTPLY